MQYDEIINPSLEQKKFNILITQQPKKIRGTAKARIAKR